MAAGVLAAAGPAAAQDCFLGEVKLFAGTFAPQGYAFAHGQQMSIGQNSALFAILGNVYGGDGVNTFALPDLRGRVPIGAGMGPGLDNINLGLQSGDRFTQPRPGDAQAGTGASVATPMPISNMQPSTGLNYIVCTVGLFPSQ